VVSGADLGHDIPVLFNAVGGTGIGGLPAPIREAARERLERAAFLSVRDPQTKEALDAWGLSVEVRLAPDCGVLVAELLPATAAADQASDATRRTVDGLRQGYLVFQAGRYPAWGLATVLAGQLRDIHRQTGLALLLLPLGQAPGHEDLVPLRSIAQRLRDLPVKLLPDPDIDDIALAIANAALFVGSSLHGNLTALAYGVPHVGFGARVAKLDHVLRTWDPTCPDGTVEADRIAAAALAAMRLDRETLTAARASAAASARKTSEDVAKFLG
jgi:polysaccharide pyruvyl transferase WcaK-like protein